MSKAVADGKHLAGRKIACHLDYMIKCCLEIGNIRHSSQGRFLITDTAKPFIKKVRVITDIRYALIH